MPGFFCCRNQNSTGWSNLSFVSQKLFSHLQKTAFSVGTYPVSDYSLGQTDVYIETDVQDRKKEKFMKSSSSFWAKADAWFSSPEYKSCRRDFEKKTWMLHSLLWEPVGTWPLGHIVYCERSRSHCSLEVNVLAHTHLPSLVGRWTVQRLGYGTVQWAAVQLVSKGGRTSSSKVLPMGCKLPTQNPAGNIAVSVVRLKLKNKTKHFVASFFMASKKQ